MIDRERTLKSEATIEIQDKAGTEVLAKGIRPLAQVETALTECIHHFEIAPLLKEAACEFRNCRCLIALVPNRIFEKKAANN